MKGAKVLDSWALLAYFEGQTGCHKVADLLKEASEKEKDLFLSVVNWGEVLYIIQMRYGENKKREIEHLMEQMHLKVINIDKDIAREAAHFKATKKLPYADCFAAALAKILKASVVTGDADFSAIEHDIKVEWIDA